ncbi:hypothetical protein RND71_024567 [Anisodus tanguticus]|uniref:Uncharacterized protein n=1 Tax=Anisodus tanguticus TaxID=243964 RepID=A0AAE1RRD0_9SOLA|nr:hypothetical protein RND71_024567 [Anisodus tanguticus]
MATHTLSFSLPSSNLLHHNTATNFSIKPTPISTHLKKPTIFTSISRKSNTFTSPLAIQDSNTSSETEQNPLQETNNIAGGDDVASEINKLMKEREGKEPDFWSGVVEEIREIEWPVFGKVLSILEL